MPRAPKKCGHPSCQIRVTGRTYCTQHEAVRQARMTSRRPSGSARYGPAHKATRAQWAPAVEQGIVHCWRCELLIEVGQAWDLGHLDDMPTLSLPEHANQCNRSSAGMTSPSARVS